MDTYNVQAVLIFGDNHSNPLVRYYANASGRTITHGESGSVMSNDGASGTTVMQLPDAAVGLHYAFVDIAAQVIDVKPSSGQTVQHAGTTGGDGVAVSSLQTGSSCSVIAVSDSSWLLFMHDGSWSF